MRAILRAISLLLVMVLAAGPAIGPAHAGDVHLGHVQQDDCDGAAPAHDAGSHCVPAHGSSLLPYAHALNLIRYLSLKVAWRLEHCRALDAFRPEASPPPPRTS